MITRRSRCATSLRLAGREEEEEEEEEEAGPRIKSGVTRNGMAETGWEADCQLPGGRARKLSPLTHDADA